MYSRDSNSLLHDHIIDGFASTHEGLRQLKDTGVIEEDEYTQLLEKNVKRLIDRIKEFRMAERLICVAFAFIFGYLQIAGEDLEMRRARRMGRGRRKGEYENIAGQ